MALKRLFKDTAYLSAALAPAALQDMGKTMADLFAIDLADLINTNIPTDTETDEATGETTFYPVIGYDEQDNLAISADPETLGAIVVIIEYGPETEFVQIAADQPPLAVPKAVFLLNLPNAADMFGSVKLHDARDDLLRRHLVAAGRKIARAHNTGEAPLVVDRIAALLTVTGKGGANRLEEAFNVMFRALQHSVLAQAKALVERLRTQNQHARARDVSHVYTAARFNKANVRQSFASRAAAEHHFPTLPQKQWENLLRAAIQGAPKFAPPIGQRDEAGKLLKDAEGKTVYKVTPKPQSPAIFQQWLATREQAIFQQPAADDMTPVADFAGLTI